MLGNKFGEDGVCELVGALMTNTALTSMDLSGASRD